MIDPRQLTDERFNSREDYREQMAAADVVIVNRRGGVQAAPIEVLRQKAVVVETSSGSVALTTIA
ncbi:hypothetical protein D3C83_261390 [compost metagenome]